MAAPMLTDSDMQGSLKNQMRAKQQKKKPKKLVLCSPYDTERVDLPAETQEKILQKLVEALKPLGIAEEKERRQKERITHQQRNRKEKKEESKTDHVTNTENHGKESSDCTGAGGTLGEVGTAPSQRNPPPSDARGEGPSNMSKARKKICFGINEVIKGLERDQMRLVLACKSCKPEMLTQQLIGLAASRNCPASVISNLSSTLCPLLKMSSLMALGVKKYQSEETTPLDEAANFIISLIPQQTVPWIERVSTERKPITDLDTEDEKKEEISLDKTSIEVEPKPQESVHMQQTTIETDYSQFYVYKSTVPNKRDFGADFIAFTSDNSEKEKLVVPDLSLKRRKEVSGGGQAKFRKYQTPGYLPVFGNEQKVKNSKKKKQKNKRQK